MADNGDTSNRFSRALNSGLLGTIAWGVVLIIYCVFRAFGIQDPLLGQAFLLLTGAWVGNLTIAQGRKNAAVAEKTERVEQKVDKLTELAKNEHPEAAGDIDE